MVYAVLLEVLKVFRRDEGDDEIRNEGADGEDRARGM